MRIVIILFILASFSAGAQKTDKKLQAEIEGLFAGFHGAAGVFVIDLKTGKTAAIGEDSLFPTASIVKIPIMIGVMSKLNDRELDYHQVMVYTDSLYYSEGEDILASFKSGEKISLSKLLMLSLSTSDNTASLCYRDWRGAGRASTSSWTVSDFF